MICVQEFPEYTGQNPQLGNLQSILVTLAPIILTKASGLSIPL